MANSLAATGGHPLQVVANKLKIGKAERRFAEGKWWLVAPLTTIPADGILNGSKGPGFYPSAETQATVRAWDGMPLTAYHPMDEVGRHTSAGAPGVLDRQGIGIVRDSVWNGKLQHKGWFDEERTKKVNPVIYHNLVHRIPIETSTGLYTDNVAAPKGSSHNGRPYTWVAKNYRPDHIAVLPDQVGACLLPGQEIQGRLVKGSKAWYTGEAVRIWTRSGETLAVTANHPVLTPEGFTPSGELTEGQYLLHYVGELETASFVDNDEYNAPALAEDAFETLKRLLGAKKVKCPSVLDFHGDGTFLKGNVEVIFSQRTLGSDGVGSISKGHCQRILQRRSHCHPQFPSNSPLDQSLVRVKLADIGCINNSCEPLTLLESQSCVHQPRRLRGTSGNSSIIEPLVDDSVVEASIPADVKGTLSFDVGDDDGPDDLGREPLVENLLFTQFCVFGPGAELDVGLPETVSNCRVMEAKLFTQLLHTFPGKVTLDEIIRIDRFPHDGPVYDFETTTGYMVAQKLIVSNCSLNDGCGVLVNVAGHPVTATQGLVVNQAVQLAHWVENACRCNGSCGYCKPTLNSLTINPFVSESQRRACYAQDDPDWNCDEWEDETKGKRLPEKKPSVENLLGSSGHLHIRSSSLQVLASNYDPDEARGEDGKWAYTGAAGDRGKTLHKHSQAAHDGVTGLAEDKELGGQVGKSLQDRNWWDRLFGHYDAQANSERAVRESSVGNHALAAKYHLAVGTQLSQAANEVGRAGLLHRATRGWLGSEGDKKGEAKLREAASKHMYAGGEAGGGVGFGDANKLTEDAHEASKGADKHKVAWLHHAAVNAHLKASQAWRDEADKQDDEGLKKVLGSIATEHQNQAWEHGKSASQAEVGGSGRTAPKAGEKKYEFLKPSTNQLSLRPTLVEVENFNPFHDLKGKFAAAAKGVGTGLSAVGSGLGMGLAGKYGLGTGIDKTATGASKAGLWVGGKLLTVPVAAVRVSAATLLHGLAGGAKETGKTARQLGGYIKDIPKPAIEKLTEVGVSVAARVGKAYDRLTGTTPKYSPSVAPTNPAKTGLFGAGAWGKEYQGADKGSKTAAGIHSFSLAAQSAATSAGLNFDVIGKAGRAGSDLTQRAYRDAQLGNHGAAAEKHVGAAELLQKAADGLKTWHLQTLQRPGKDGKVVPVPPAILKKLSDADKQALRLEDAAKKNRLAAIMQGNNPVTASARHLSIGAFASARSAEKKGTSRGYLRAAQAHAEAKQAWEAMVPNEHNHLYKTTYAELAKHHTELADSHNAKALQKVGEE